MVIKCSIHPDTQRLASTSVYLCGLVTMSADVNSAPSGAGINETRRNIRFKQPTRISKRHHSGTVGYSVYNTRSVFHHRRSTDLSIIKPASPSHFLLGGNIADPLNLESLNDEEISKIVNAVTPKSSPIPVPAYKKEAVEVIIPPNIHDPLGLNSGEESTAQKDAKKRNKKRHKTRRRTCSETIAGVNSETVEEATVNTQPLTVEQTVEAKETTVLQLQSESNSTELFKPGKIRRKRKSCKGTIECAAEPVAKQLKTDDEIVSPVVNVPVQISPKTKRRKQSGNRQPTSQTAKRLSLEAPVEGTKARTYKPADKHFRYGNYSNSHFHRHPSKYDHRLRCLKKEWFSGKDVLDIGCSTGDVASHVARHLGARKVVGVDIDESLINKAKSRIQQRQSRHLCKKSFPSSVYMTYGSLATGILLERPLDKFPNNVEFIKRNYVLESDDAVAKQQPQFDVILLLNTTKYIHLNWGDEGLKRAFRRVYKHLRPGGRLILEAQAWPSYAKKKYMTEDVYRNYLAISLKPDKFTDYLLSREVGFSTCELLDRPFHRTKGFQRSIYMFTKSSSPNVPVLGLGTSQAYSVE